MTDGKHWTPLPRKRAKSEGVMQCGPAPVKAIKNGEIYIGQDTDFLFAEVCCNEIG